MADFSLSPHFRHTACTSSHLQYSPLSWKVAHYLHAEEGFCESKKSSSYFPSQKQTAVWFEGKTESDRWRFHLQPCSPSSSNNSAYVSTQGASSWSVLWGGGTSCCQNCHATTKEQLFWIIRILEICIFEGTILRYRIAQYCFLPT